MPIPISQFITLPTPYPLVTISLFSTFVTLCFVDKFICTIFFRFHIQTISYDICLFLFDLLHSVWQSLGPSMLLQMTLFCSFYGWVTFHYIHVPHLLYPFLCWWIFRLLPCLGYCKQCCNEHWGAYIFSNYGFLQIYAQERDCWIIW